MKALSSAISQLTSTSGPLPDPGIASGGRRHAGPQQDAVGQRVAGGHAVQEGGALRRRGRRGTAASGAARAAVAAAALTTVRRLGVEALKVRRGAESTGHERSLTDR